MTSHEPVPPRVTVHVPQVLADLIPEYLERRFADARTLSDALARRDFPVVQQLGHRLKGNGQSFGFTGITAIGAALERAAADEDETVVAVQIGLLESYLDRTDVVYDD